MASEQDRLKALIDAGVGTDEDVARLKELESAPTPALAAAIPVPAPVAASDEAVAFEDSVDIEKFKEGGEQYHMPSQAGVWKSKLVEVTKPNFIVGKDLKIFNFETDDPKLNAQGRGAIWVEMSKGAFSLKTILDGIGIPYTLEGSIVKYAIKFPYPCYADWSIDPKGKASGNVLLTGLRTLEAGAAIEPAI